MNVRLARTYFVMVLIVRVDINAEIWFVVSVGTPFFLCTLGRLSWLHAM